MQLIINDIATIRQTAANFLKAIDNRRRVIAFHAPMGAGKTTFIKALCEEMGVDDVITSPTFAIVNEYTDCHGAPIYHFDFYRIRSMEEVADMGADDYFYSGAWCFIEWPETIAAALPPDVLCVTITPQSDGSRIIEWQE